MRCAVHTLALKSIFEGHAHPVTGAMVMSAKLGITQEIISEYSAVLGGNQHFQAWFSAAQAGNRLVVKRSQDASSRVRALSVGSIQYGVASYFSAGRLCKAMDAGGLDLASLGNIGVVAFDVSDAPPVNIPGDNPILSISLASNGGENPSVLDNFLLPEDQVVIYDKYINEAGLQLIEYIASKLDGAAALHVRTTDLGATCKRPQEILSRISLANPSLQTSCLLVSPSFRKQAHDRYIFFGKRLQAVFTVGLDCFGVVRPDGTRRNRQSKINVYALDNNSALLIEALDGSVISTPYIEYHHC